MDLKKRISPALVLLFLAPMIGELLSGSSPPVEFFGPFGIWALPMMYGCGALLVREAVFKWKKGWVALLLLGAAYGIAEEALACKSFFDPGWSDIGVLGSYGRWAGVNWLWAVQLTTYHAAISIATPILLTSFIFPEKRREPWLTRKGLYWAAAGFVFIEVFCFALITPYFPPVHLVLLSLGIITLLVYAAYKVPCPTPWESLFAPLISAGKRLRVWFRRPAVSGTLPPVRKLLFSGLAFMFGFYLVPSIVMGLGYPAPVTGLALLVFFMLLGLRIAWLSGFSKSWTEKHQLALVAGGLGFFIFLAPIQELTNPARPDDTTGMTAVGIAFVIFLVWIYRRLGREMLEVQRTAPPVCAQA
jgi:hypothetical protein